MNQQEALWAGGFGDEYQDRSPGNVNANRVFFEHALRHLKPIRSVIEFGAGSGANIQALQLLLGPDTHLSAVEINRKAISELFARCGTRVHVHISSILGWRSPGYTEPVEPLAWDLAFTKGLLIHIAQEDLRAAYETLYRASARYILIAEYYNPTPVAIPYRGQENALWKRDFAGEMLKIYPNLRLIDYGFTYHLDPYPQDDLTFFLMEKIDSIERHP